MERCHCTIATRKRSVEESVYLYNITPNDDKSASTAPVNGIYIYQVQVKGLDIATPLACEKNVTYKIGDLVWVCTICMSKFGKGVVTGHHGLGSVLVNGMLHHIRDLHPIKELDHNGESSECESMVEGEDSKSSKQGSVMEHTDSTQHDG